MSNDEELSGIGTMTSVLSRMDESARKRSIEYLIERFDIQLGHSHRSTDDRITSTSDNIPTSVDRLRSFPELYEKAAPSTDKDRALVGAYWFQVCSEKDSFQSMTVNKELKNLGFGLSNIAETLRRCCNDRPATVLQVRKSGSSQQARKAFRLTQAGIRRVEGMLQVLDRPYDEVNDD